MNIDEAIQQACDAVGIMPAKVAKFGAWMTTDTMSGSNGKGDGRIIVDGMKAIAWNWQTGQKATVWLNGACTEVERREIDRRIKEANRKKDIAAVRAARIATKLIAWATLSEHLYLKNKGFQKEQALVVGATDVAHIAGKYIVPRGARRAIIIPARVGQVAHSAQLIWEDGTKKFLSGGRINGASHRLASGTDTWLCEGLATGLSLRTALKSLNRNASILICFSASNICAVARSVTGRCFVVADNDKPMPQFSGRGTGEHFARMTGVPYIMPPTVGHDLNDMHQHEGIFAVQRLISDFLRGLT